MTFEGDTKILKFIKANEKRKPKFRINIRISEENQKKIFIKSADIPEAYEFLQEILQKENLSREFFGDHAKVVTGNLKGEQIYYPYLDYPTLEDLISENISKGDKTFGRSFIEEYIRFINKLPSSECIPDGFMKLFGIRTEEFECLLPCLKIGPIDCIPSNILVNEQFWYIIDHEWTIEHSIPIDFLIYRGIYSLIIHLQEHIQAYVSNEQPVVLFSGYGKNRTYIPISWLELLRSTNIPIATLYYWEWLFQSKANISTKLGRLRLKKNPRIISKVKPVSPLISALIFACVGLNKKYVKYMTILRNNMKNHKFPKL